jgi:predicted metal-dependent phosphoesterase TrpH
MPSGARFPSRRTPLIWAIGLTAALAAGAIWPIAPLREGDTRAAVTDGRLRLSPGFLAIAPVNNTLDALSLLSVREHATVLLTLLVVFVWRRVQSARRQSRRATQRGRRRDRALRELAVAAGALVALFIVYAAMILAPRPMAALAFSPADSDQVAIDFHSHTSASHDGRPGFTAERNRAWHRDAGFNVAYVTDHFTFDGAEAGGRANPARADGGTVLLSGIECLEGGEHVNVLGVTSADYGMFHGRYLAADAVDAAVRAGRSAPLVLQTIPGPLDRVPRPGMSRLVPVNAIELSDGAPRGLSSSDRDHARILRLADSLNLTLVAGSDNHGWGRTAAGWSVIRIAGWRRLTPSDLERRIEDVIRTGAPHAGRVVERTRPIWAGRPDAHGVAAWVGVAGDTVSFLAQFSWQMVATRSWPERISWLVWIWVVAVVASRVQIARPG